MERSIESWVELADKLQKAGKGVYFKCNHGGEPTDYSSATAI